MSKIKKILVVGNLNYRSRATEYVDALDEIGYGVKGTSDVSLKRRAPIKSIIRRISFKIKWPLDENSVNSKLVEETKSFEPDLVLMIKPVTINPSTLKNIKKILSSIIISSFHDDDMFARNKSLKYWKGLKHYDFVFTTKKLNLRKNELPKFNPGKVVFVNKAYNEKIHKPVELSKKVNSKKFG